jgi:transcriptional regulator with XRE-family HTH domain
MNRVREIREAKGITLKELARRVNIMPFWLQRIEQYQWDRSPYGLDFDLKLAEALGVDVTDIFPAYAWPKREPETPPKPDTRTPEEIDETLRILNERRQAGVVGEREIYDAMDEVEEWCPGVLAGPGARPHLLARRERKRQP